MTITTLTTNDKKTTTHAGTSGFTVIAQRDADGVGLEVLMEFDNATLLEGVAMVGAFLAQLEDIAGESFVAACIAHYAEDTGKHLKDVGNNQMMVMIRGGNRGKPPKAKRG